MHIQTKNKDYRPDIDGLRAIAITSVILYHINPAILPGGFTGVDIFFVISGFLITSHLVYAIYIKKKFSFKIFYLKRIKRIVPALFFMCLVTLAYGYIIFTNSYFKSLGEQALTATLSISNIYFYLTSGYFDLDSSLKPLLHTWSLGVEEQFYLIWPAIIFVIFLASKNIKYILFTFFVLFFFSFYLNHLFHDNASAIFYLMPFRIFEFVSGGTIAVIMHSNARIFIDTSVTKQLLSALGIILILLPLYFLTEDHIIPYYNILPTVIGSGLIIFTRDTIVSKILSLRLFVFIGLISYSLYLYHWPVIVYAKYEYGITNIFHLSSIVLLVSFVLAILSYLYIEKPFRFAKGKYFTPALVALVILTPTISSLISASILNGLNGNNELVKKTIKEANMERFKLLSNNGCNIAKKKTEKGCKWEAKTQILFFGNSHNLDGYNIFRAFLQDDNEYNLIFAGDTYYCKYKLNGEKLTSLSNECANGADKLLSKSFLSKIDILVVDFFRVSTWGADYLFTVDAMKKLNPSIKIIVIGGYIGLRPNNCSELINKTGSYEACKDKRYVSYWGTNEEDWLKKKDFTKKDYLYVDLIELLCGKRKDLKNCTIRIGNDLMFYDGDHFSLNGSLYTGRAIHKRYQEELSKFGLSQ